MRVLHIVPTYRPAYRRGGPIWSVHSLNKWLVKKGLDVTVYTTDIDIEDKIPLNQEVLVDGVRVFYFCHSYPRIWEYWRVGFLPAFLPRHWEYSEDLHKMLSRTAKNFDLIHITSTFLFASVLGAYYAKKNKKPYIISPRGNLMEPLELKGATSKKLYIKLIEQFALQDAVIHCTVLAEKEHYDRHKLPFRDTIIIPNGIEEEDFLDQPGNGYFRKLFNLDPEDKLILFLGRLNWKKGLDTLIPAMARVVREEPRAFLVIAGGDEGGYKKTVQSLITIHKLQDRIIFTDMLMGKDKIGALKDATVFVLPSYSENFGMAVVEAMYFGLPVVVTKNVGISPYLMKNKAGLVIEKNDKELSEAILKVLRDSNFAQKIGEAAKSLVKEEFAMPKIADSFIAAYNIIVKENKT